MIIMIVSFHKITRRVEKKSGNHSIRAPHSSMERECLVKRTIARKHQKMSLKVPLKSKEFRHILILHEVCAFASQMVFWTGLQEHWCYFGQLFLVLSYKLLLERQSLFGNLHQNKIHIINKSIKSLNPKFATGHFKKCET